jgi:hypothetical protein
MEVILRQPLTPSEIGKRLNAELPVGLKILKAVKVEKHARQITARVVTYEATLEEGSWPTAGFQRFQSQLLAPLRQKSKRGETLIQLTERLLSLESLDSQSIRLTITQGENGTIRVRDLLMHIFGLSKEEILDTRIVKISSEAREG